MKFIKTKFDLILEKLELSKSFIDLILKIESPITKILMDFYNDGNYYEIDYKIPEINISKSDNNMVIIGKNKVKIGRLINKVVRVYNKEIEGIDTVIDITDKEIEDFVDSYKNIHSSIFKKENDKDILEIHVTSGKNIKNIYSKDYIFSGTIMQSCMNDIPQNWLDIYTKNPKQIELAYIFKDDKLAGRALLWKLDDGRKFLGRIYYSDNLIKEAFINFASYNNYIFCSEQTNSNDKYIYNEEIIRKEDTDFRCTLDYFDINLEFPYIDNMSYGIIINNGYQVTLCNRDNNSHQLIFQSDKGSLTTIKESIDDYISFGDIFIEEETQLLRRLRNTKGISKLKANKIRISNSIVDLDSILEEGVNSKLERFELFYCKIKGDVNVLEKLNISFLKITMGDMDKDFIQKIEDLDIDSIEIISEK